MRGRAPVRRDAPEQGGLIAAGWRKRWAAALLELGLAGLFVALAVLPPLIATLTTQASDSYY